MPEYRNPEILRKLYWEEDLSAREIAKRFGIDNSTVLCWMKKFGIPRRPPHESKLKITKGQLEELYTKKKLSSLKIAEILGLKDRTVRWWLHKFGIPRRSPSEAGTKYPKIPFSGDLKEKAYMLGLRAGDFYVQRISRVIRIKTSTTHLAQIELTKEIFGKYNFHVGVYKIFDEKFGFEKWKTYCDLDISFKFLLEKQEKLAKWILNNNELFFNFLAAYADCEGHFRIFQSSDRFIRFSFMLTSTNMVILKQIKNKLKTMDVVSHIYLNTKAGRVSKVGIKSNKNIYNLVVYKKENVITLVSKLIKISHHKEKIWKMNLILESSGKKWEDIKDNLIKLKDLIKENTLSKERSMRQSNLQTKELPY